jgi:benzaldehyde dehydrogenase (NAD)
VAGLLNGNWQGRFSSNGWREAAETIAVTAPATGETLAEVGKASADDVHAACAAAREAQPAWAARNYDERAGVMREAARLFAEHEDEFAGWLVREGGGTRAKAALEHRYALTELLTAQAMLYEDDGVTLPSLLPGETSLARRVPLGVVGVISPWNYPVILALRSVAPALATGNAVVLKPASDTPVVGGIMLARLFEEAGLPEGVLHVLPGKGSEAGSALAENGDSAMISFTGSSEVGRTIGESGGRALKRVALELGGKNPFVVLDDADVERAAAAGAFGQFFHQGQTCMAIGRHVVHERVADDYVAALVERAESLEVGDPATDGVEFGPIINESQIESMDEIVSESVAAGAELRTGGRGDGLFFRPTVLVGVEPGMPAFEQEIFGPVAAVTVARDEEHAVELANAGEYGLVGGVFGGSLEHALAVANRIDTGMAHVNEQTIEDEAVAPFGGRGASGNGISFGSTRANWDAFTHRRWTTLRERPREYAFR